MFGLLNKIFKKKNIMTLYKDCWYTMLLVNLISSLHRSVFTLYALIVTTFYFFKQICKMTSQSGSNHRVPEIHGFVRPGFEEVRERFRYSC